MEKRAMEKQIIVVKGGQDRIGFTTRTHYEVQKRERDAFKRVCAAFKCVQMRSNA